MAACPDKQVADNLTFWVCSFHGSFCSSRSMLLGRRVRASCRVTLCIGLLPRKLDAGSAGPFSWCHGNQLALRPRRRGAAWSAHATTAVANISKKKSKAYNGNWNKARSHVFTVQSNTCSHAQPPPWCNVIFPFTQPLLLPHPAPGEELDWGTNSVSMLNKETMLGFGRFLGSLFVNTEGLSVSLLLLWHFRRNIIELLTILRSKYSSDLVFSKILKIN